METAISLKNVRYCFGNVCALNGVSFSVPKNSLTVLVGPNGGGKSTLIRLIAGLLTPDEGSISGGGIAAYVPQNLSFDISFPVTVRELVLMGMISRKLRPFYRFSADQRRLAEQAMQRTGIIGVADRGICQLSGGQRGRALIARALVSEADIIALDEPDASLDINAARSLYAMLYTLKSEKTIIMASHHIGDVLDIADYVLYVNNTISAYASAKEFKDKHKGGIAL